MKVSIYLLWIFMTAFTCLTAQFNEILLEQESLDLGAEIFLRMQKAIGDVSWVRNIYTSGTSSQPIEQGYLSMSIEALAVLPDKFKLKFHDREFIIDRDKGWMKYSQGYYESLTDEHVDILMGNLRRNLIDIIQNQDQYIIRYNELREVDDKQYDLLSLSRKDEKILLLLDSSTYLPTQMVYEIRENDIYLTVYRNYLEYQTFSDIRYPVYTITQDKEGNVISENKLSVVRFNVPVDKDEF